MYIDDIILFAKNEKKKKMKTPVHAVKIYNQNIEMEFGIKKWAILIMKIGKQHMTNGLKQPNQEKIRILGEKKSY